MTLKVRIIPSILLKNGMAVKSQQFTTYRPVGSYINAVRVYNTRDVDELVILDIAASAESRVMPAYVVTEIAGECRMPLTIGGGIRQPEEMHKLFGASADKVSINTAALARPTLISEAAERFGSANLIVSIDVKRVEGKPMVFSQGGKKNTQKPVLDWVAEVCELGAGEIYLNSIDQDGMMKGFDLPLIKEVTDNATVPVIAAGGAGEPSHFVDAVLQGGADAVSAASIFHFTEFTPRDVKERMAKEGISVRLD